MSETDRSFAAYWDSRRLGHLSPLLKDLATVRRYAKIYDLSEEIERLLIAMSDSDENILPSNMREQTVQSLAALLSQAGEVKRTLERLRQNGWRLDPLSGKLKAIVDPQCPNRPMELFNLAVLDAYDHLKAKYRKGNFIMVREAISRDLKGLFDDELLGTGRGDPIWNALKNHQTRGLI